MEAANRTFVPTVESRWVGLLVFLTVLSYKPIAHSILVLLHKIFPGHTAYPAGFVVGLIGFALVWNGLKRDELAATASGYAGGSLIWMGWFEHTFDFFGESFGLQPLLGPDGKTALGPNLMMMEASGVPFLALLILLGANRETRCRLLMWCHKTFNLTPDRPTTGYKRNYAWVTALETVFVTWAFYLMIILVYDPRIAGKDHPFAYVAFAAFALWSAYLVRKMVRYAEPAAAIRYAIPTTNAVWICIEMASHWKWLTEIWVKPTQYPIPMLMFVAFFAGSAVVILRGGASPRLNAA